MNCINFTQQQFGLTNHGIPAQQKALNVACNFMSDLSYRYEWVQTAFTEPVDRINECFYFDKRDNEFYSIFITDYFLTDKNSKAELSNIPYSDEEMALLNDRINRQESNDPSILPLPRLTIDERKQMMQSFLVTQAKFDNTARLQEAIDIENGRTNLDFNDLLDDEAKRTWKQFKSGFIRERVDSFCNLNNIDIESSTLWTQHKVTKIEMDLTDDVKPNVTKSIKPWWRFW